MSLLLLLRPTGTAPTTGVPAALSPFPTISGTQRVGSTLTTTVGTWTNSPTSFTFQWARAASSGGPYTDIAGATSQAYVLQSADLNQFVRVLVSATNASGTSGAFSPPTGQIQASLLPTPHLAAQRPSMFFELDLSSTLSGSGSSVWTDATGYVRDQIQTKRGRANVLDKVEAGTGSFAVDNADRRFEPEYAASPYYPNVTPMRGARLRAVYNGVFYPIHRGYVEGWPMTWPSVKRARSAITSTDGSDVLNAVTLTQIFQFGYSGAMINAILDAIAWPSALRLIDAGTEVCLGIDAQAASPLEMIQSIADSELGLFFFDAAGNAVFHDRDHRLRSARSQTVQAVFGDIGTVAAGELPYLIPETSYDISFVYNDVEVSSGLATPTTLPATDPSSQASYGIRSLSRSTLLLDDNSARDQAGRILATNKQPRLRFPTLTLDPTRDARLWPVVLGLEISDRVRVIRRPYAGGAAITKELWVEATQHDITLGQQFAWTTTLALSLADTNTYFTLDSATRAILDSTTVLR